MCQNCYYNCYNNIWWFFSSRNFPFLFHTKQFCFIQFCRTFRKSCYNFNIFSTRSFVFSFQPKNLFRCLIHLYDKRVIHCHQGFKKYSSEKRGREKLMWNEWKVMSKLNPLSKTFFACFRNILNDISNLNIKQRWVEFCSIFLNIFITAMARNPVIRLPVMSIPCLANC